MIDGWTGMQQNKVLLTMPQTSSAGVSIIACGPEKDIWNTHCDSQNSKSHKTVKTFAIFVKICR